MLSYIEDLIYSAAFVSTTLSMETEFADYSVVMPCMSAVGLPTSMLQQMLRGTNMYQALESGVSFPDAAHAQHAGE